MSILPFDIEAVPLTPQQEFDLCIDWFDRNPTFECSEEYTDETVYDHAYDKTVARLDACLIVRDLRKPITCICDVRGENRV